MEQELLDKIEQLEQKVANLEGKLESHGHTGSDGTSRLNTSIEMEENNYFKTGSITLEGINAVPERILTGGIVVGEDKNIADGSDNSQVTIQHGLDANNTFMFGFRKPIYTGSTGSVSSGGTTMSQTNHSWDTNELAGAYVAVYDSATVFDVYPIASNTSSTITISGGTWSFSESGANFIVFIPIYFGSAEYPWRRLYTLDGTGGGVRFGRGQTNAGQQDNGLLYSDSAGDLYWRNYAGTAVKLN